MIAWLLRTVKHVLGAVVLLALLVCAGEVALRGVRFWELFQGRGTPITVDRLPLPSRELYQELPANFHGSIKNADGQKVDLRINSEHCRGPEFRVPKPSGVYRVLVLGDDTIFAAECSEADSFCGQLKKFLQERSRRKVEVINAALPGACPLQNLLQVRLRLLGLQPDLVVQHYDVSDLADDHLLRRFSIPSQDGPPLSIVHPSFDSRKQSVTEMLEKEFVAVSYAREKLEVWLRTQGHSTATENDLESVRGRYSWLDEQRPLRGASLARSFQPLGQLRDLYRANAANSAQPEVPVVICTCPKPWQVSATALDENVRIAAGIPENTVYTSHRPFEELARYCEAEGLPLVDASLAFRTAPNAEELFCEHAEGLSAEGHAFYAQLVADELIRRNRVVSNR